MANHFAFLYAQGSDPSRFSALSILYVAPFNAPLEPVAPKKVHLRLNLVQHETIAQIRRV